MKSKTENWHWSEEHINFLTENYAKISNAKIAKHLGRTASAIAIKAMRMQLVRPANNSNKGQFKHGHGSSKSLPLGTLRPIKKLNNVVLMIKTQKGWVSYAKQQWETIYGPIPRKCQIHFKDGDRTNCDISNLELLKKGDFLKRTMTKERRSQIAKTWWGRKKENEEALLKATDIKE